MTTKTKAMLSPGQPVIPCTFWNSLDTLDQQLSVDRTVHRQFRGVTAFDAGGKTKEHWNSVVWPMVYEYLRFNARKILRGHAWNGTVHCWMLSLNGSAPSPHIVITNLDEKVVRTFIKVLRRGHRIRDTGFEVIGHRGNLTALAGTDCPSMTPLGFTKQSIDQVSLGLGSESQERGDTLPTTRTDSWCGIKIGTDVDSLTLYPNLRGRVFATLGGAIEVGNSVYGLMAGHPFLSIPSQSHNTQSAHESPGEQGFWINDDGYESESSSLDGSSLDPSSCQPTDADMNADELIFGHPLAAKHRSGPVFERQFGRNTGYYSRTLDWVLLKTRMRPTNCFNWRGRDVQIRGIANSSSKSEQLLVLLTDQLGHQSPRITNCCGGLAMIRLPSSQETVAAVPLDCLCERGDSGAWVVGADTGDLYGMVVAADEGLRLTYMLRAQDIFDDISRVTGHAATLPKGLPAIADTAQNRGSPRHAADQLDASSDQEPTFVVAIDFGTTYSSVSFAKTGRGTDAASLSVDDIRCIDNYKNAAGSYDARMNARIESVPTELLYLGSKTSVSTSSDSDSAYEDSASGDSALAGAKRRDRGVHHSGYLPGRKRRRKWPLQTPKTTALGKWTRPTRVSLKWGFEVPNMLQYPEDLLAYSERESVKLIKLSLGNEVEWLSKMRTELDEQIQRLQLLHFIRDRNHVLEDYLTRLLHHTRSMLKKEDGLDDQSRLEFVLCVPVLWSESACRIMHSVLERAIGNCNLEPLARDIFMVSEPEAAAQFVLTSLGERGKLHKDEVFTLIDAGGGTVDIATYTTISDGTGPLRLQKEIVPADGALCGSALMSSRFASSLRDKIQSKNLRIDADMEATIMALTNHWDTYEKPGVDLVNNQYQRRRIFVHGHRIEWTPAEIRAIFEPSLKGVTDLLEKQLDLAGAMGLAISKVIVVGGFGESPSLRDRIKEVIALKKNIFGNEIEILWPREFAASAVSRGAVLRALNKRNGPSRILRSSFGFLRHEPYGQHLEHMEADAIPTKDLVDQSSYVKNTIYWAICAGTVLPTTFQTEPIVSCHRFSRSARTLICVEELYSSPRSHRSHFPKDHQENEGAALLSHIEVDMSAYRDEFPVELNDGAGPRTRTRNRYCRTIVFDLVLLVEGRQLKYEARWPSGALSADEVRVRRSGYISLSPSFVPGTE